MAKTPAKKFTKLHFLLCFWLVAGLLYGLKKAFPVAAETHLREVKEMIAGRGEKKGAANVVCDSIEMARLANDSIFMAPRSKVTPGATEKVKPLTRTINYSQAFPDTNQVHLATALRIGAPECLDRDAAMAARDRYVYIGESPYFDMETLTYSVPYLVPRAARLADEIGRNFLDSLASKGIPMHKLVVTSVLRTQADVKRLRHRNGNASEQSCHLYGTTIDISYNHFRRVQDPDLPPQTETYSGTLKAILAEVLDDLRQQGSCYVKYEYKQACFHITCR